MAKKKLSPQFVICVKNEDCEDLEPRKVYRTLPDKAAAHDGYLRVIDETGKTTFTRRIISYLSHYRLRLKRRC